MHTPVSPAHLISLPLMPQVGKPRDLAWSPDGRQLAAVSDRGYLCLWQTATGHLMKRLRLAHTTLCTVTWTRQPGVLNAGSSDGWIYRISRCCATPPAIGRYRFATSIAKIAWSLSPLGRCLILTETRLTVLDERSGQSWSTQYALPLCDAAWASDGRTFALLLEDGQLEIWDAHLRCMQAVLPESAEARCFSWHPDEKRLLVGSASGQIQICDLRTQQRTVLASPLRLPLTSVQWSKTGVIVHSSQEMARWKGASKQATWSHWEEASQTVAGPGLLRIDPNGERLAIATNHALTITPLTHLELPQAERPLGELPLTLPGGATSLGLH